MKDRFEQVRNFNLNKREFRVRLGLRVRVVFNVDHPMVC